MKVVLATLNAKYIHSSLAVRCLKEYCQPLCSEVVIREYTINNSLLDMLADLYAQRPDAVGMACYIWNIDLTLRLVALLRKVLPEVIIILGGPEVSYYPEEILEKNQQVDYVIQGEGELTLNSLLLALDGKGTVGNILGLAHRLEGGAVVNSEPQVVADLTTIPFAYQDADMVDLQDKIIYYESSRGCPFCCQYCLSSAVPGVRFLPVERVCKELEFFIIHHVKQVKFVDRTFNTNKEHYYAIWRHLASLDCETNFHFEIAADILDTEVLSFLATVPPGRFQFEIGIQSTHKPTLGIVHRYNDWPAIVRNVNQIATRGNIHMHLDLIVGLPGENYEQFSCSFNHVYELYPDMLQIGFLKLLKGTGIRTQAAEHDYVFMDEAPYEVLANNCLSYDQIRHLKILENLFDYVYNSGRHRRTLLWLIASYGRGAFAFYDVFAYYWEAEGLHLKAHSEQAVYRYLVEFCDVILPGQQEICRELLKFDALLHNVPTGRFDVLLWNGDLWSNDKATLWRDEARMCQYIPDYEFSNWREVKQKYPIEVFTIDIPAYLLNGTALHKRLTPVLFYQKGGNWHSRVISEDDFPLTGGGPKNGRL